MKIFNKRSRHGFQSDRQKAAMAAALFGSMLIVIVVFIVMSSSSFLTLKPTETMHNQEQILSVIMEENP